MHLRWVVPILLALAAPSGLGGAATGGFIIEIQVLAGSGRAPAAPAPGGGQPQDSGGPTTCSSSSGAVSVRVNCNTPTFVQISELDGPAVAQLANEGVSLLPAETALRLEQPERPADAPTGALYEIRRRDSLSTLVAVQQVDPDSRTVELLVTF
jgi:hypothetical protein